MTRAMPVAPSWSGRVLKYKIARLYQDDACGMQDEKLLNKYWSDEEQKQIRRWRQAAEQRRRSGRNSQ